jgi:uncharacterized protein YbjT (DUF2867 family)
MTVMVTGASGPVGDVLIRRLLRKDEVRACVRRPEAAEPLRALGAKVALGRLDDADALADVLGGVFTLFHLVGGPNHADDAALFEANHGSTLRAITAAKEANVPRIILVSVPGANPEAVDPFLRAKGLAEEAVITSGLEHAVVRSSHVYGLGGSWFAAVVQGALARPPVAIATALDDAVAPVLDADLAAVLVAADDREGDLAGTWALEGPEVTRAADLTERLVGPDADGVVPLEADRAPGVLAELLGIPVSRVLADHLLRPSRADATDAATAFGVGLTRLDAGLAGTFERVAAAPLSDG